MRWHVHCERLVSICHGSKQQHRERREEKRREERESMCVYVCVGGVKLCCSGKQRCNDEQTFGCEVGVINQVPAILGNLKCTQTTPK